MDKLEENLSITNQISRLLNHLGALLKHLDEKGQTIKKLQQCIEKLLKVVKTNKPNKADITAISTDIGKPYKQERDGDISDSPSTTERPISASKKRKMRRKGKYKSSPLLKTAKPSTKDIPLPASYEEEVIMEQDQPITQTEPQPYALQRAKHNQQEDDTNERVAPIVVRDKSK